MHYVHGDTQLCRMVPCDSLAGRRSEEEEYRGILGRRCGTREPLTGSTMLTTESPGKE